MICFLPTRANKERRTGELHGAFFRDACGFGQIDDKTPSPQEELRVLRKCYKEHTMYSVECRGDTRGR